MPAFGFLLPLSFAGLVLDTLRRSGQVSGWREAALFSAAITGVYLTGITELLSSFGALTTLGSALLWLAGCALVLVWRMACFPRKRETPDRFPHPLSLRDRTATLMLLLIGEMALILMFIAVYATPNTYDSMTYHLARVAHWFQDRSVALFATNCLYQNQHCPWAEWMMLQLMLLQGNDHLANLVQWSSYVGSIVAVSLITEACGGSRRAAIVAAFLAATLPMAILQATSTQNDEVLSFWLLCFIHGALRSAARPTWPFLLFCGASLGLAMLTKTLAYLYAPPIVLWLVITLGRRGFRFAAPRLAVIGLLAIVLNGGYYFRNWSSSGTLLGNDEDSGPRSRYTNEVHGPGAVFSNVVRNLSLQAPQFSPLTAKVQSVVEGMHRALGLDPADPRVTAYSATYYVPPYAEETECANPLHLLAFAACLGVLLAAGRRFSLEIRMLAWSVLAGAFLFCLVLKWQPFHARLHLPLFLMMAPVVAVVLEMLRLRRLTAVFAIFLLVEAFPPLFLNRYHPLAGQANDLAASASVQRFAVRPMIRGEYEAALDLFHRSGVKRLGVIGPANNSGWEYPLFDPDHMRDGFPWRIEQVKVNNSYAALETREPTDAVVTLWPASEPTLVVHGQTYHQVLRGLVISVYSK